MNRIDVWVVGLVFHMHSCFLVTKDKKTFNYFYIEKIHHHRHDHRHQYIIRGFIERKSKSNTSSQ